MKSRVRVLADTWRARLRVVSVGFFLVFTAGSLRAISLYDIVQLSRAGKSDAEIISLIETTQARFVMDAKTVTELKKAGVSERVIQALIQAGPPPEQEEQQQEQDVAPTPAEGREPPGRSRPESEAWRGYDAPPPGASRDKWLGPAPSGTGRGSGGAVFGSFPFEETGLGHGTDHDHFAVSMAGIPVLLLRSEAGHRSVAERATEAAARLSRAIKAPGGRFFPVSRPHPGVKYRSPSGSEEEVLDVSRGDVIAYQRRSVGPVSSERLAAYWSALLNDYTGLLVGEAPTELATLHLGESLERLQRDLRSRRRREGAANASEETFLGVVDHLPTEDKDHLIELALRIPAEFRVPKRGAEP
jgi:hypothetical protein